MNFNYLVCNRVTDFKIMLTHNSFYLIFLVTYVLFNSIIQI